MNVEGNTIEEKIRNCKHHSADNKRQQQSMSISRENKNSMVKNKEPVIWKLEQNHGNRRLLGIEIGSIKKLQFPPTTTPESMTLRELECG